jgi:hypothetical protein
MTVLPNKVSAPRSEFVCKMAGIERKPRNRVKNLLYRTKAMALS